MLGAAESKLGFSMRNGGFKSIPILLPRMDNCNLNFIPILPTAGKTGSANLFIQTTAFYCFDAQVAFA